MNCNEYKDLVAAHADGALTDEEARMADAHSTECSSCRTLRDQQVTTRAIVRQRVATKVAPDSLRQAIARQRAAEITTIAKRSQAPRSGFRTKMMMAGAIAAALLLSLVPLTRNAGAELLTTLAADVGGASSAALAMTTEDPDRLRGYYADNGMTFSNTVADLRSSGLRLVGGKVSSIGPTPTTLTMYADDQNQVVCRRFRAEDFKWPTGGKRVGNSQIFSREGVHISVTPIGGDVFCAMASSMPMDRFLRSIHAEHD